MRPTVYIDVLFITNFIMDFFLLCITGRICKNRARTWRCAAGAAAGSIYSVFMFFPNVSFLYSALFKLAACVVIVFISYKIRSVRSFIQLLSVFFVSSFALAGAAFGLFYLTPVGSKTGAALSNGIFYIGVNPVILIGAAALCFAVLHLSERVYIKHLTHQTYTHKLCVTYKGSSVKLCALLDSANFAMDPVTNMPIIICTVEAVRPLFRNEDFYEQLCDAGKINLDSIKIELICDTPFRMVPYRVLGDAGSVMPTFEPSALEVDGKAYAGRVLIGLCAGKLLPDTRCDALLHPRIMANL